MAKALIVLILLSNTFAMANCNLKIMDSSKWGGMNYIMQGLVDTGQDDKKQDDDQKFDRVQEVVRPNLPPIVSFPEGYPTAAISANSISRQKLMQLLHNPAFKRPNMDDLPVHVEIKLIPIKIQDLIEKNEVLETTVRLQLTWVDIRLAWNMALFNNITEMVIPGNLIWVPDITILNSVSDLYHVVRDTRFEMKILSSGKVWWHPTGIVKTNCKLYLRYFPFDKQLCKFVFESPTFDLRFMNLTLRSKKSPVDTRMYTDGETWQLLSHGGRNIVNRVGSKTLFARVEFLIRIERAKIFHLLNVILPAIFLSTVQVMFFLLPATHPQRVGSSTTTLLSVVVFQTVAVAQLPKTSTDIPLLSIYIFFVIIVSALSVGTSIIVAKFVVYAESNVEMPRYLSRIPHPMSCWHAIFCCLCCCCRVYQKKVEQEIPTPEPKSNVLNKIRSLDSVASSSMLPNQEKIFSGGDFRGVSRDTCIQMTDSPLQVAVNRGASKNNLARQMHPPRSQMRYSTALGSQLARMSNLHLYQQRYLFKNWNDVSRFVDICLLLVAASIAVLSPVALFVIMPVIAEDRSNIDYQVLTLQ